MDPIFKIRIDALTYNLIYPAFFGNMVYDIILFLNGDSESKLNEALVRFLILLFTVVDFVHLYGDMNNIVKKPEMKSRTYLFCDLITSFLIFIAFVLVCKHALSSLLILSAIPLIIFFYKKKNPNSKTYFKSYSSVSLLLGLIGIAVFYVNESFLIYYLLIFSFLTLMVYGVFVFYYYKKKCMEWDIEYIDSIIIINKEY